MIHHAPLHHRRAPRLAAALAALVAVMLASPAAPVAAPDEAALLPAPDLVAAYPAPARRLIDLAELADRHRDVLRLEALPGTEELRPGPVLATLGLDGGVAPDLRPAILVVGGLDPSHLVGIEAAHRFVAHVAARTSGPDPLDPVLAEQLRRATIYVVPCLDMAGALTIASSPRGGRRAAAEPHDDDGDALVDKDPADDLDGDGHITSMRIADPAGRWIEDARDARIMHRARPDRGERGRWRLETEGRDDDGDGRFNEDGRDGTILARHWPLGRDWNDPLAGVYPLRRGEAKALAEFLVARENIAIVVALGPDDTLASPTKGKAATSSRRPLDDWDADDAPHLAKIATAWREAIGLDAKATVTLGAATRGTLGEFAYHARGRLAFAMGVWSPSLQMALEGAREEKPGGGAPAADGPPHDAASDVAHEDTTTSTAPDEAPPAASPAASPDTAPDDAPDDVKERRKVLAWFDREVPGAVRPWREVPSVARDGARTEVGGLVPFAEAAPPPALVDDLLTSQSLFLAGLLDLLPHVDLVAPSTRELSPGVYDVTVHVLNTGRLLPTRLAHGRRSDELRPEWVEFDVADDAIVAGRRRTRLEPIAAGDTTTVRAVVAAPAGTALRVVVTSAHAGRAETTIVLGEGRDASPPPASGDPGSTPPPAPTPATEER